MSTEAGLASGAEHTDVHECKRPWSPEEDQLLRELYNEYGKAWSTISQRILGRTTTQVAARWEKVLDPSITKGAFTGAEDAIILEFVSRNGATNWPQCKVPNRSAKQCRERYFNHLDPNISKEPWTDAEDDLILEQVQAIGPRWSTIARMLKGRSDNAVKNRWHSTVSKRVPADSANPNIPEPAKRRKQSGPRMPVMREGRPPALQIPPPRGFEELADCSTPDARGVCLTTPRFLSLSEASSDEPEMPSLPLWFGLASPRLFEGALTPTCVPGDPFPCLLDE